VSFATPVSIPHWAFPVTLSLDFGVLTTEQGSTNEIQSNVLAIVSCPVNTCPELPTFGIPDPTFQTASPSPSGLVAAVQQLEPRASLDTVVQAIDTTQANWQIAVTASVATSGE
jgi:hypothetical protein